MWKRWFPAPRLPAPLLCWDGLKVHSTPCGRAESARPGAPPGSSQRNPMPFVEKPCTRCHATGTVTPCTGFGCRAGNVECPKCHGSGDGQTYSGSPMSCMTCNGRKTVPCTTCKGSIFGMECPKCRGSRYVREFVDEPVSGTKPQPIWASPPPAAGTASAPKPFARPTAPAAVAVPVPVPATEPPAPVAEDPSMLKPLLKWGVALLCLVAVVVMLANRFARG